MRKLLQIKILSLLVLVFFITSSGPTFAQSYSGGQGGGYASTLITTGTLPIDNDTIVAMDFGVTIYPNPLKRTENLNAKITGAEPKEKIGVIVSDMIGSRVFNEVYNYSDIITISLPQERLSKGIYLITFEHKGKRISRRFTFAD